MTELSNPQPGTGHAVPLKMGMIGGGPGAFIGKVHRMAARLDGDISLVGGAFSRDRQKSLSIGAELHLEKERIYPDYSSLLEAEAKRVPGDRMDFISIVTPNHLHFPIAAAALRHGFAVLSDKPATLNLAEACELRDIVTQTGGIYGLAQTYLGYPMVRQARHMVMNGMVGDVRRIAVEYPQGWLTRDLEKTGHRQAVWRTNPETSGAGGCLADIGTHAHSLVEYITGDHMTKVASDVTSFGDGRVLDDDIALLFRMKKGARGTLVSSQICAGADNGLKISIYGDKAGLEWAQQHPNQLSYMTLDAPRQIWVSGTDKEYLCPYARKACRLPAGHPEGYIEAFANIYHDFALQVRGRAQSDAFIGIAEGVRGMAFVEAVLKNHLEKEKWTEISLCR